MGLINFIMIGVYTGFWVISRLFLDKNGILLAYFSIREIHLSFLPVKFMGHSYYHYN